ncbi:hypothetical protein PPERSA_08965 [Pseudocohnilembus persalinus]|uniref:Uncharacterized protein n=1 Tax=Pseudocohnilembus persalinus TaxID=266149 RepID=A0A0V0R355_PSEPJ|nr:hypothetical protein PPERSA_08965 [Pseudocohnilembus persalinus]|eukprot:KRX08861.1 hypothetical protein PPERSA_08965 [Pseudocohnilembus persalinus]
MIDHQTARFLVRSNSNTKQHSASCNNINFDDKENKSCDNKVVQQNFLQLQENKRINITNQNNQEQNMNNNQNRQQLFDKFLNQLHSLSCDIQNLNCDNQVEDCKANQIQQNEAVQTEQQQDLKNQLNNLNKQLNIVMQNLNQQQNDNKLPENEKNKGSLQQQEQKSVEKKQNNEQLKLSSVQKNELNEQIQDLQKQKNQLQVGVFELKNIFWKQIIEQKKLQKKIDAWYIRKFEKIELLLLEKNDSALIEVINKIRSIKKNKPWKKKNQENQLKQMQNFSQESQNNISDLPSLENKKKQIQQDRNYLQERGAKTENFLNILSQKDFKKNKSYNKFPHIINDSNINSTPFSHFSSSSNSENDFNNQAFLKFNNKNQTDQFEQFQSQQQQQKLVQNNLRQQTAKNRSFSENNSVNQAFIMTGKSYINNNNIKIDDDNNISQIEQMMLNCCLKTDQSGNNLQMSNLRDVQLEDLLNVTQQYNQSISLDLDFNKENIKNNRNETKNNQKRSLLSQKIQNENQNQVQGKQQKNQSNNLEQLLLGSLTQNSLSKKIGHFNSQNIANSIINNLSNNYQKNIKNHSSSENQKNEQLSPIISEKGCSQMFSLDQIINLSQIQSQKVQIQQNKLESQLYGQMDMDSQNFQIFQDFQQKQQKSEKLAQSSQTGLINEQKNGELDKSIFLFQTENLEDNSQKLQNTLNFDLNKITQQVDTNMLQDIQVENHLIKDSSYFDQKINDKNTIQNDYNNKNISNKDTIQLDKNLEEKKENENNFLYQYNDNSYKGFNQSFSSLLNKQGEISGIQFTKQQSNQINEQDCTLDIQMLKQSAGNSQNNNNKNNEYDIKNNLNINDTGIDQYNMGQQLQQQSLKKSQNTKPNNLKIQKQISNKNDNQELIENISPINKQFDTNFSKIQNFDQQKFNNSVKSNENKIYKNSKHIHNQESLYINKEQSIQNNELEQNQIIQSIQMKDINNNSLMLNQKEKYLLDQYDENLTQEIQDLMSFSIVKQQQIDQENQQLFDNYDQEQQKQNYQNSNQKSTKNFNENNIQIQQQLQQFYQIQQNLSENWNQSDQVLNQNLDTQFNFNSQKHTQNLGARSTKSNNGNNIPRLDLSCISKNFVEKNIQHNLNDNSQIQQFKEQNQYQNKNQQKYLEKDEQYTQFLNQDLQNQQNIINVQNFQKFMAKICPYQIILNLIYSFRPDFSIKSGENNFPYTEANDKKIGEQILTFKQEDDQDILNYYMTEQQNTLDSKRKQKQKQPTSVKKKVKNIRSFTQNKKEKENKLQQSYQLNFQQKKRFELY